MHEINSLLIAIYSFIRHLHRLDFLREIEVDLFSISFFYFQKMHYNPKEQLIYNYKIHYNKTFSVFGDNGMAESKLQFVAHFD